MNSTPSAPRKTTLTGITLRRTTDEDQDFLFRLYSSTREQEMAMVDWSEQEKQDFLRMQLHAQNTHYFQYYPNALWDIIEEEETPIGRLYVEHWEKEIRIIDIALCPEARGKGIGGGLMQELLDEGERVGKRVSIHVEQYNPARRLYERLGFEYKSEKEVYLLMEWSPASLKTDQEKIA